MRAETVLKLSLSDSFETAQAHCDEFIREYDRIAKEDITAEDMAAMLKKRALSALEILKLRSELSESKLYCADDAVMDEYIRDEEKKERLLDGDFPLGNEFDAEFALPYFSVAELALIQLGRYYEIAVGYYNGYNSDVLIRKGFINEMQGNWSEAERCYGGVSTSESVQQRELYCCEKAASESEELYRKGMKLIEELCWDEAWYPLSRAADSGHTEAMAEIGYMTVYGIGCGRSVEEGLELLRKAASLKSDYACRVLWEMYDDGITDVTGAEAEKWCRQAASRGDKKAEARLADGFDLRPLSEILQEQIDKGNKDAIWLMAKECEKNGDQENAGLWFDKALEARQRDAVMLAAEMYSDKNSELYDEETALKYYRIAADEGVTKAMILLGDKELKTADTSFFDENRSEESSPIIKAEHKKQLEMYERAALAGDHTAAYYVSRAYALGYPEKNAEKAFLLASRGADNGDALCMYMMGYLYENGIGCDKDMNSAMLFYIHAADKGVNKAIKRLIEIYTDGKDGIAPDKQKASYYIFLSGAGRD